MNSCDASPARHNQTRRNAALWLLIAGGLTVILLALLLSRSEDHLSLSSQVTSAASSSQYAAGGGGEPRPAGRRSAPGTAQPAEEIVASKLSRFAHSRSEIVKAIARRHNMQVPEEVGRFFDAAENGRWDEMQTLFKSLKDTMHGEGLSEGLKALWPPTLEAYGVAECAHNWPAQGLLDYGHAILDVLPPGAVYVGGTDPGRFIPTLMTETGDGERHIVVTQNALADNTYLQYVQFLYADQLSTLTEADSQKCFQEYLSDAQKRLLHDQEFPNEPRQIRPGEDIKTSDGRMQVSGQIAVMGINEKLFQRLMELNPDATFAIEQSFPLQSTYAGAAPLGPIMELRVTDNERALSQDRAAQAVDYWRTAAQQPYTDAAGQDSLVMRQEWSKMASEQAALLQDRGYGSEAEQTFRYAVDICPSSPEGVFRYVNLLMQQNRINDALQIVDRGRRAAPDNEQFRDLATRLREMAGR